MGVTGFYQVWRYKREREAFKVLEHGIIVFFLHYMPSTVFRAGCSRAFTGFCWVLLGFTGFYRVLLGFTEFCGIKGGGRLTYFWNIEDRVSSLRGLPSTMFENGFQLGFTGFYWVLLSLTRSYWILRGYTNVKWSYWLLLFFAWYLYNLYINYLYILCWRCYEV